MMPQWCGGSRETDPMTNDEMKEGRFLRWHKARKLVAEINAALESGATVQFTTYLKATRYTKKHIGMIKAGKDGIYTQHGRRWLYSSGCKITVFR